MSFFGTLKPVLFLHHTQLQLAFPSNALSPILCFVGIVVAMCSFGMTQLGHFLLGIPLRCPNAGEISVEGYQKMSAAQIDVRICTNEEFARRPSIYERVFS